MYNVKTYHTYLSSAIKIKEYVKYLSDKGIKYAPICDDSSCSGYYELQVECNKVGIKPIFGVEVNVCRDAKKRPDKETQMLSSLGEVYEDDYLDTGKLKIWAIDDIGLKNLYKIVNHAWSDSSFYYKPRTDIKTIIKYSEGIYVCTGGVDSWINKHINEDPFYAQDIVNKLYDALGDRLIIEKPMQVLRKDGDKDKYSRSLNLKIIDNFYKSLDLSKSKHIDSAEIFYIKDSDYRTHCVLRAIDISRQNKSLYFDDESIYNVGYNKSSSLDLFLEHLSSNTSSNSIIEDLMSKCSAQIEINPNKMVMPDIGIEDPDAELRKICEAEMVKRGFDKDPVYSERLEYELSKLKELKFSSYIMYVKTILDIARELDIPYGPGRGSGAGSLVNYLVDNTLIDPIQHDLLFERYIDPQRVSPPDNDIDFPPSRVPELINAIIKRWGKDRVAFICSFSEIKPKVSIKDCCRIFGVPIATSNKLASLIDKDDNDLLGFASTDAKVILKKYHWLESDIRSIIGLYRQTGQHAAGIVASNANINEYIPTHTVSNSNFGTTRMLCSSFDMVGAEGCGLLKVDILKLSTIDVLQDITNLIKKSNSDFDINKIPLDDEKTLELFRKGDFDGVFQFDTPVLRYYTDKFVNPYNNFNFIPHLTSVIRPGPADSGQADQFIERYNAGGYNGHDYHPIVSEITKDTYGVMIYQEQVSNVFKYVSRHKNPDAMRKLIAKSKGVEELEKHREEFVADACKYNEGFTPDIANRLFDDIATFGRYGFNKSHAVAYSLISYQCQWLKANYKEFAWYSLIKNADEDSRRMFAINAKKQGVKIRTIDVNSSMYDFSFDYENPAIVEGFSGVVGIQDKTAQKIIDNRPYENESDLIAKLGSSLTKKMCECGAARRIVKNSKFIIDNVDDMLHRISLKKDPLTFENLQEYIDEQSKTYKDYSLFKKRAMAVVANKSSIDNPFSEKTEEACKYIVDSFKESESLSSQEIVCLYKNKNIWFRGYVSNLKEFPHNPAYNRQPTEKEKEHESFGKLECTFEICTENGSRFKVKVPWDQYKDSGIKEGSYILLRASFGRSTSATSSCVIVMDDLTSENKIHLSAFKKSPLVKKLKTNPSAFGNDSKIVTMDVDKYVNRIIDEDSNKIFRVYGVVTSKRGKITKEGTGDEMMDFSIICAGGIIDSARAFGRNLQGSSYDDFMSSEIGSIVRMDLKLNSFQGKAGFIIQDDSFMLYE